MLKKFDYSSVLLLFSERTSFFNFVTRLSPNELRGLPVQRPWNVLALLVKIAAIPEQSQGQRACLGSGTARA